MRTPPSGARALAGGALAALLGWALAARAAIVLPPQTAAPQGLADQAPARSIQLPQPTEDERAATVLLQSAEAGDLDTMLALGDYYHTHPSLPQAAAQARRWWQRGAQAGDPRAMAALGHLLSIQGGSGNTQLARQWLDRSAALGLTRAVYLRSRLARESPGPREAQLAARLLEQAAREGDVMAMNDLGVQRELDGNLKAAAELYQRAAAAGLDVARQNLTRLRAKERGASDDNLARLQVLAQEGDADALLALARRYHRGDGVARDYARAIQYYQRAADAGSGKARETLALIFSRAGDGGAAVDEGWMQELAGRISAAATWSDTRRAGALSRPTRVEDPLVDLLKPLPIVQPGGR